MKDEQQLIVDTLKFTPRRIRISIWGYGGEIVMGLIPKEAYDYWRDRPEEELSDFVLGNCDNKQLSDVPAAARFVGGPNDLAWYDCDQLAHESGVELRDFSGLTVTDVDSDEILFETRSLDPSDLDDLDIETECVDEYYASFQPPGNYCFLGQSVEKGVFFEEEFEIQRPFDPAQLKIYYNDIEGLSIFYYITHDGNVIDNQGNYDTTGKGMQFAVLSSDD
jgi:hypothetical protein